MKDVTSTGLTEIPVTFTPAVIEVDYALVKSQLDAIVEQYKDYEVTASTYKTDFDERTRLNKLKQGLETRRKEINAVISEPYKHFKKLYDEMVKPLDDVIAHITEGLNAVDEHERILRVGVVRAAFEDRCMVAGLMKESFADKYEQYSLKKYFKPGKFELKKTTLEEFDALVLAEFDALEAFKASQQTIRDQAQEYGLLADGYLRSLEDGKTLVDVLNLMKSDRDAEMLRKEQEEVRAKAEVDRLAEIEQIARENADEQIKAYNADTGEVLDVGEVNIPEPIQTGSKTPNIASSEPLRVTMLLTLHGGKSQLDDLKEYLEDNFISFETMGGY